MSHKNLHTNTYGRINGDTIKTTSSVIFHGHQKIVNNLNIKNVKNVQPYRLNPIPRYASQQQLKKIPAIQATTPKQKKIVTVENQYFRHGHGHGSNHRNQYTNDNEQKAKKVSNSKKSSQEKKGVEGLANRKYVTDTNSTTSNQKSRRQSPSQSGMFFRTKPKMIIRQNKVMNKISRQNFKLIKKLGEGKFGKVYLVRQIITGFVLAMKVIEKKKITQDNILEQFIRELKIQTFLEHPNIINLYGFFHDQTYFYSLMEVGCDGQLYTIIEQNKNLTQMATSFITKSLLEAVQCMHNHKILHRDIKPQNIVIIMGNVKMCDFGWAVNKVKKEELRSTFCGTPLYLSPQILKGYKYDEKVDLWAIGIMAYELCVGSSPFQINEQQDLYKILTQEVKFPKNKQISAQFQEFISYILHKNPKDRLPSQELLKLRFIKKYQEFETCEQLCS